MMKILRIVGLVGAIIIALSTCTDVSLLAPRVIVEFEGNEVVYASAYDLGELVLGVEYDFQVTLRNTGNKDLYLLGGSPISFGAEHSSFFRIEQEIPTSLAPGEETVITIYCVPSQTTDEIKAVITIENNDENLGLFIVNLSGTVVDATVQIPPVPGGNQALTIESTTASVGSISWIEATDDTTPQTSLQYRVYFSLNANIDTVVNAEANGSPFGEWQTAITGETITGLSPNTEYYVNVLARDASGNKASYTIQSFSTLALGDQTITFLAIPGITAPVTGVTPATTTIDTTQYTGTITWSPAAGTFAASTVYTANIVLTAKAGFTLTGVSADSFTVVGAAAINPADSGVVTAVFPGTAATVINIA
ncbi:MAG: fibronectin type III domain-containing protein, partial [Spirochaetales bacterium]|nr:fibronectin type III domain-containing protein [Spirochaetales bacterium]